MAAPTLQQLLDARRWTREQAEGLILLLAQRPACIAFNVVPATWTNMPAAVTPLFGNAAGSRAIPFDLTQFTEARITASVTTAGSSGSVLQARLATTAPLTTGSYSTVLASVSIASTGVIDSGWVAIPIASRILGIVDILGSSGDGAADPVIGAIRLWFR